MFIIYRFISSDLNIVLIQFQLIFKIIWHYFNFFQLVNIKTFFVFFTLLKLI